MNVANDDGSHYRWFLTPPSAGAFKEASVFSFWLSESHPRGVTALQCAPWPSPPHRRIDSTEALPHASSLGERPTACNRRRWRFSPLRSFLSPSYKDRWDVYTRGGALHNAPMYTRGMEKKIYRRDSTNLVVSLSETLGYSTVRVWIASSLIVIKL